MVEHALTGDSNVVGWWDGVVGPGKALDTDKYCVLCTNALGGCMGSTGPTSLAPDGNHWGSRFPALSIRDLVAAEKQFLDKVGVTQILAVLGGSMGGARTLEWTLLYPQLVNAALVLAVSARASAWQIGIQTAQISAIEQDPDWQGGDYYRTEATPHNGLAAARRIAHLTYRGELEIDERFGTTVQPGENPLGPYRDPHQRFAVQSYLDYQGVKLTERFDAGTYVTLTEAMNRHDIGRGRGGLNKALAASQVPTMIAGVDTDILYPSPATWAIYWRWLRFPHQLDTTHSWWNADRSAELFGIFSPWRMPMAQTPICISFRAFGAVPCTVLGVSMTDPGRSSEPIPRRPLSP